MIEILVFDEQSDLAISVESAKRAAEQVVKLEGSAADELSLYFVSDAEMCRLHAEFFDDPTPTDCISFPLERTKAFGRQILGEVFVCPKTALDYVHKHADLSADPYLETTLYVVHSILHLFGYDDREKEDEAVMRKREREILEHLIAHNLTLQKP